MIKLLYFAALVDRLGTAAEEVELPAEVQDVRGLVALLKARGGAWEQVFGQASVRITVNRQFADLDTAVKPGDEVAFISAWL